MAIVKSTALVLRRLEFSETSQIVTLLTPDAGRVDCIAKGSRAVYRKPTRSRKIDGPIDTLTVNRVVYYEKRGDALDPMSECEVIQSFADARRTLRRWHAALAIQELALAAAHPQQPERDLFYAAVRGMVELSGDADARLCIVDFLARYLAAVGRAPDISKCAATGARLSQFDTVLVGIRDGRAWGAGHAPAYLPGGRVEMPGIAIDVLSRLLAGVKKPLDQVRLPDIILRPLATLLQGMVVEVLDRAPVSFRFLRLGPAADAEPATVR